MISMLEFKNSKWIYSHKFDAEITNEGWIGINMTLSTPFTKNHTLGNIISISRTIYITGYFSYMGCAQQYPLN